MKIFENNNVDLLAETAFNQFKEVVENLAQDQDSVIVALSGGSSVTPIYTQIKERARELKSETWEKVVFCFADERVVPLDSDDSNYKFTHEQFLGQLITEGYIREEQIVKLDPNSEAPHLAYTNDLQGNVDIALLGVGPDAHTCSLFPQHSSMENESMNCILVEDSPKPPAKRISLSKNMLKNVQFPFAFFIGDGKKDAYNKFLDENLSQKEVPIKIIQECSKSAIFTNIV